LETWETSQHSLVDTGKPKKNLCRGGRSQDLPDTDFYPAVRHLRVTYEQQYTHSTTNTHNVQQIHIRYNNTRKTNTDNKK